MKNEKKLFTNTQQRFLTYLRFTWWKEITDEERIVIGIARIDNCLDWGSKQERHREVLNGLRIRFQDDYRKWSQAGRDGKTENYK